jgi:hypothetical protein
MDECAVDPDPLVRENVASDPKYAERLLNDPSDIVRRSAEFGIDYMNPIIINN